MTCGRFSRQSDTQNPQGTPELSPPLRTSIHGLHAAQMLPVSPWQEPLWGKALLVSRAVLEKPIRHRAHGTMTRPEPGGSCRMQESLTVP